MSFLKTQELKHQEQILTVSAKTEMAFSLLT